jgi:hypothetical protein
MNELDIICVTDKHLEFLDKTNYHIGWVGKEKPKLHYLTCDKKINIYDKERYYSELTFHYWYWKNVLNIKENKWIGFCQKRRFWIHPGKINNEINQKNIHKYLLTDVQSTWSNYESIICNPINLHGVKKIKIFKRGFRNLIQDPLLLFNKKKHTINFHFDMHHGHGNLEKAINVMSLKDREDFRAYVNKSTNLNPHIMMISKPIILNKWFIDLFDWLGKCEKIFYENDFKGYDTTRLYAYLAERYLSFWFKKYTKYLEQPWIFLDYKLVG